MRVASVVLAVTGAVGFSGCAGSGAPALKCLAGDPFCGSRTVEYVLQTSFRTPAVPIPVGASVDITFEEQRCVGTGSQSGPPPGIGCGAWYVPAQLVARVLPISNTNTPCPITVTQNGPGALRFTKTGPGDPRLGSGSSLGGYCNVGVSDPTTGSFEYGILL